MRVGIRVRYRNVVELQILVVPQMRIRLGLGVCSGVRPLGATGTRCLGRFGTGVCLAGMKDVSADMRTDVPEKAGIRHSW